MRGYKIRYLPGSEYNDVSFEFGSVVEYECALGKVRYIAVVLELDLSFANELGRSSVCREVRSCLKIMNVFQRNVPR
jgi:hypothetical protein